MRNGPLGANLLVFGNELFVSCEVVVLHERPFYAGERKQGK
jgi:hypothetical protein